MTVIRFFTDPHIGRELKANTTSGSRALLAEQIYQHGRQAASIGHADFTICGGDLFDQDHNAEHVLILGADIASRCDLVLGGNHDVVNIEGRSCSLEVLRKLASINIVMPPAPGRTYFKCELFGDVAVWAVPHHARQEEFVVALEEAMNDADKRRERRKLLLLHCNYDLQIGQGENDLNLTQSMTALLSQTFDFIILGHDHRPRTELGGKVVILGNTHPTSFSDLGEKRVWFYESDLNEFGWEVNAEDSSHAIPATQLIEWHQEDGNGLRRLASKEWIDVTGTLPPEASIDLAKAIRALWKACPYLYAVRSSKIIYEGMELEAVDTNAGPLSLVDMISSRLPDELKPLWNEVQKDEE